MFGSERLIDLHPQYFDSAIRVVGIREIARLTVTVFGFWYLGARLHEIIKYIYED